ncbi:MAG: T9SS type A sorting domain-containing protein [candidate division Zixibacteria bacterium]|nr:T9SS type A sorting domain-containing protein [candidate division Zixibacteria bacterium]
MIIPFGCMDDEKFKARCGMKRMLSLAVLALLCASGAHAVQVSGDVSGTWYPSNNPYEVVGNLRVPSDETLIIMPGCYITFRGHYKFNVEANAVLSAEGTETDSIIFTCDTTSYPDGWHGIRLVQASDSSKITYSRIEYGNANGPGNDAYGGAVYCADCDPEISYNTIRYNSANDRGGAVYFTYSNASVKENLFFGNSCLSKGGAFYLYSSNPTFENNTVAGNSATNYGGGVYYVNSNPTHVNDIIWDNTAPNSPGMYNVIGTPVFTYSDVQDSTMPGAGNISSDPLFADPDNDDYSLEWDSPCVDSGDPSYPVPPFGGNRIDMGALEFFYGVGLIYEPDDFIFQTADDTFVTRYFQLISSDNGGYVKSLSDANWASFDPDSAIMNAWDTVEVEAVFDPSGLDTNQTYQTEIRFLSDLVGLENTTIPVEMTVIPHVPLELMYDSLDFVIEITGDSTATATFQIISVTESGYVKCHTDSVFESRTTFEPDSVIISPEDTSAVEVTFDASGLDFNETYYTFIAFETDCYGLDADTIPVQITVNPPIPVTIEMIPFNPPIYVEPGSYFTYTGVLNNNVGGPFHYPNPITVWVNVRIRGVIYGPLFKIGDIYVRPDGLNYPGIRQYVDSQARPGTYGYIAYCSEDYPDIMDSTYFDFTVLPGRHFDYNSWECYGWGVSPEGFEESLPKEFKLYQNYPNPFNSTTEIAFDTPVESEARIEIYNIAGQRVETVVDRMFPAGEHAIYWDASGYSSGVYFYRLSAGDKVFTRRMTLLK